MLEMRWTGQVTPDVIAGHLRDAAAAKLAADAAAAEASAGLDRALWEAVEARGYPLARAARDAGVTRMTAYRAIERCERNH